MIDSKLIIVNQGNYSNLKIFFPIQLLEIIEAAYPLEAATAIHAYPLEAATAVDAFPLEAATAVDLFPFVHFFYLSSRQITIWRELFQRKSRASLHKAELSSRR